MRATAGEFVRRPRQMRPECNSGRRPYRGLTVEIDIRAAARLRGSAGAQAAVRPIVEALCGSDADLADRPRRLRLDPVPGQFPRDRDGPPGPRRRRHRHRGRRGRWSRRGLRARRRPAPLRPAGDRRRGRGDRRDPGHQPGPGLARALGALVRELRVAVQRAVLAGAGRLGEGDRPGVRADPAGRRVGRAERRRGRARPSSTCSRSGTSWPAGAPCPSSSTCSSSASATAGRRAPGSISSSSSTAGTAATTTGGCST